ncbi:S8 family serine peptidase [Aestuariivirga sp. YIM B02566]|uniref:S8 family serine peptidase n=1 Tax=Taklimakanibacter albus TaxID=2800327 RepID=A0ACC5R4S1_9HYPH|nr:S8 family serine peptidase [Aestuariivirga sp. YIM B02566]MBK1867613.1 S8 family serine peptidase [Aestuariivirga sp. YIM B02566]
MYRDFLKAAGKAAMPNQPEVLTPGILRFTFEYKTKPNKTRERRLLRALIGSDRFQFFPLPPGEDPLIHVLQFPGVVRQQSSSFLFDVAQHLVDDFDLESCVPDVDPGWIPDDDLMRQSPESIGGIFWTLCKSNAAAPTQQRWAVQAIKADQAWSAFNTRGEGILIGQPDTGVADHRELDTALDLAKGKDILAGSGLPIDPLSSSMSSPGHGTGTSSVAVSRASLSIIGSAPGATLVPVRCIDNVVIGAGGAVAAAIDHARLQGCHVITMSLGGPIEGADLKRAIERAVKAGMIVLAAAGNCVPFVVYPAWDKNVIAVAGVNHKDKKWKGSSHGSKVDVSAPAENVYIARRNGPADTNKALVEPGQGTSFAVALTAGCAALWLARHGVPAVRTEATKRGTTVHELFRSAVKKTVRKPANWPSNSLGAGIVDALALLKLPLAAIPAAAPVPEANPGAKILESAGAHPRFVAEAGYLAADRIQRQIPERAGALESATPPRPSDALAKALHKPAKPIPSDKKPGSAAHGPRTAFVGPRVPEASPAGFAGAQSSPESAVSGMVTEAGPQKMLDRIEKALNFRASKSAATESAASRHREFMTDAEEVVTTLATGASPGRRSAQMLRATTEAIVLLTGRPALRIVKGMVDPDDPQLGDWAASLGPARNALKPLFDAVGRIDVKTVDGQVHVGTGTVIGKGLVMTNRHVIDVFAEPMPAAGGKQRFLLNGDVSICFDEAAQDDTRRFAVKSIVTAGRQRIGPYVDLAKLDVAILEVETTNKAGKALPKAAGRAPLLTGAGAKSNLVVAGYPAAPPREAAIDPDTGKVSTAIWDRFFELFGDDYGMKYVCPGRILNQPGSVAGDKIGWAFSHDATTLGGNSGSAVLSLHAPYGVGGLHFGGEVLRQNLAHDLATIAAAAGSKPGLIDLTAFGSFFPAKKKKPPAKKKPVKKKAGRR